MKKQILFLLILVSATLVGAQAKKVQGISLLGDSLLASTPGEKTLETLAEKKNAFDNAPEDIDNIIWYGRWTAYAGDYLGAIGIYTKGIEKYPKDARLYRHRGHRYLSTRQLDKAIEDFNMAVKLIKGKPDQVEPDGIPNAQNKPISTLQSNVWYHLGLAHFLQANYKEAINAYKSGLEALKNDDNLVSLTHWYYMALKLRDKDKDAEKILASVKGEMDIIENFSYYNLLLFYQGKKSEVSILSNDAGAANDAVKFGVANWYLYNDRKEEAKRQFESILNNGMWASFGYLAAEAALAYMK